MSGLVRGLMSWFNRFTYLHTWPPRIEDMCLVVIGNVGYYGRDARNSGKENAWGVER